MKIGIFGGTFNPPHKEHINMIKKSLENGLDEVVVLPSNNPPHKTCNTDFSQRVDMLHIALLGVKNVTIDEYENRDDGVHYSFETIPKLKEKYGDDIVFIIGGDSLIDFHKWKHPELIIKQCQIWAFNRGDRREEFNHAKKYWEEQGAQIKVIDYDPDPISSSLIRHYLNLGYTNLLDPKLERYIVDNGLYREFDDYFFKLSKIVEENTFHHCIRTAKYALYINDKHSLGLNNDSVLLAGLLHDCAKKLVHIEGVDKSKIPSDSIGTPVEHQFLGAVIAKDEFGIDDEEILNGIKYHTTGKPNMTTMEKLIYTSDLLEEGRTMDFLVPLRKAMDENFEKGFYACIMQQYDYLCASSNNIYQLTIDAANYYKRNEI